MVVLLATTACGEQPTEPVNAVPERASALAPMPGSGTFNDGGLTYGYGCPISPCPVPASVSSEISGGFYLWNPGRQTIYLYRIKVPVTVREIIPDIVCEIASSRPTRNRTNFLWYAEVDDQDMLPNEPVPARQQ
jgi:hypothetical protein